MDSALIKPTSNKHNLIVQPFPIYFDCNDYHVMLFFKSHPEYESIEAMIKEHEDGAPFIRTIITRLNQTQVDHINDKDTEEMLKNRKRKREVYYTPIHYEREEKSGKAHIVLKFISFKGEDIVFDFYAPKASDRYASLINPGGHSMHISLPVMYPERTTLAGPKSKMVINGIKYKVPVKVWIPLFFKGMRGYYSETFNIGVFRAGTEHVKIIRTPVDLKAGEKWIYESGNEVAVYEITDIKDNTISILKENESVTAEISDAGFKIKKISVYSASRQNKIAEFSIEFMPSLLVSPAVENGQEKEANFSISIDNHTSLITGKARAQRNHNEIKLLLTPVQPEWAAKRPVSTVIRGQDGEFILDTEIVN